jgi:DNA-binding ferritin-like protein
MLTQLLAKLQALLLFYETAHWQVGMAGFYADHQLLGRLYDTVEGEIDGVAERAVGNNGISAVNLGEQLRLITASLATVTTGHTENKPFFQQALKMERELLSFIETNREGLSAGTRNMVEGIADTHEGNVYLLKQRLADNKLKVVKA